MQCPSTAAHHSHWPKPWEGSGFVRDVPAAVSPRGSSPALGRLCSAGSALSELSPDGRLLHGSGLYPKHRVLDDERLCLIGMWPLPSVTRACGADGLCQAEHSCAPAARLWEGREKSSDKSEDPGQLFQQDYAAYNCQGALLEHPVLEAPPALV